MSKVTEAPTTESRKLDHIRIIWKMKSVPRVTTGLERYRFMHEALPELCLNEIDTTACSSARRGGGRF